MTWLEFVFTTVGVWGISGIVGYLIYLWRLRLARRVWLGKGQSKLFVNMMWDMRHREAVDLLVMGPIGLVEAFRRRP